MTSGSENEKEVAKALVQLEFYLKALDLSITVKELYRRAYQHRLGEYYNDHWIDLLLDDPEFQTSIDEPFTTQEIFETLIDNGHKPILFALVRYAHRAGVGFSHRFVIGITQE